MVGGGGGGRGGGGVEGGGWWLGKWGGVQMIGVCGWGGARMADFYRYATLYLTVGIYLPPPPHPKRKKKKREGEIVFEGK